MQVVFYTEKICMKQKKKKKKKKQKKKKPVFRENKKKKSICRLLNKDTKFEISCKLSLFLLMRQFAWNIKTCFLGEEKKSICRLL